ncbi:abnormal long morphology protein 1-like [Nylanderia fulva]|uniref:abnormal long morphology protein 1-like n=1 Tax=Nylanderia fulva TaxID=613905 RepID=UPI0010FB2A15|nr:abnormal long morphology protein 1-like [Nylanderia fulva]
MEEGSENADTNTQNVKFIDTLITQWMKYTGNAVSDQTEEVTESANTQKNTQQALQKRDRVIHDLRRKLKESQEAATFLSTSLETETRNKAEIRIKLNATWETIETITEYFNYISESLTSFEQHRINLSALYDGVIHKQQEDIKKMQLNSSKSKDLEDHVTHLKNELLLREKRLQETMTEQNKLCKQLENVQYELQLQKNQLNMSTQEKLKEQQCLSLENENLKSRLKTIKKENYDIAKSAAQLENKLLLQEKKMQDVLTEQNKLQKQVENTERELHLQKSKLTNAHAEEKINLVKEKQELLSEFASLQSRINILEQDKTNITETIAQKDELLSKFQDEIFTYKNQIEMMQTNNHNTFTKCEALIEKQNMLEKDLRTKTERMQNLETVLNTLKQRESKLINDINRMEKKLTTEMNYSKDLTNKLSKAQEDLQLAQNQNKEMQKTLEMTKKDSKFANKELQQQLKALKTENGELLKRENTMSKSAQVLYENAQAKHAEEVSALKSDYEMQLLESKKTIDSLHETINNVREENTKLNKTLIKIRAENNTLKSDNKLTMSRNEDFQNKLKEATEALQMKSTENRKKNEFAMSQPAIFTFEDHDKINEPLSPISIYPMNSMKEIPKEQEAEVTSVGRKFFKSRSSQPRTYTKRSTIRKNLY